VAEQHPADPSITRLRCGLCKTTRHHRPGTWSFQGEARSALSAGARS
jgi:hypothetical protein